MFSKISISSFGRTITSFLYYFLSHELDKKFSEEISNIISYFFSAIFNFIFQYNIFSKSKFNTKFIKKYIVVIIIELTLNQLIVMYLIDIKDNLIKYLPKKLRPYYITIARIIVVNIVF